MPSLTIENYIKTIFDICAYAAKGRAATGQLAQRLGVSPGTVTCMLKTLSASGLVRYAPYEGVSLTASGRTLALRVLRRHRLIEQFLATTLDLTWDEVHEEAENMEHAVSDLLVDRIEAFLGYPKTDPHGDPIPTSDGELPELPCQALSDVPTGRAFRLVRVIDQSPGFLQRLSEKGLDLGVTGYLATPTAGEDAIRIRLQDTTTSVRRHEAEKLLVECVGSL